jgi:hypothetical protein
MTLPHVIGLSCLILTVFAIILHVAIRVAESDYLEQKGERK